MEIILIIRRFYLIYIFISKFLADLSKKLDKSLPRGQQTSHFFADSIVFNDNRNKEGGSSKRASKKQDIKLVV